jgi:hypothetical protein
MLVGSDEGGGRAVRGAWGGAEGEGGCSHIWRELAAAEVGGDAEQGGHAVDDADEATISPQSSMHIIAPTLREGTPPARARCQERRFRGECRAPFGAGAAILGIKRPLQEVLGPRCCASFGGTGSERAGANQSAFPCPAHCPPPAAEEERGRCAWVDQWGRRGERDFPGVSDFVSILFFYSSCSTETGSTEKTVAKPLLILTRVFSPLLARHQLGPHGTMHSWSCAAPSYAVLEHTGRLSKKKNGQNHCHKPAHWEGPRGLQTLVESAPDPELQRGCHAAGGGERFGPRCCFHGFFQGVILTSQISDFDRSDTGHLANFKTVRPAQRAAAASGLPVMCPQPSVMCPEGCVPSHL